MTETARQPAVSRLVDFVVADKFMLEMLFEYIKVSEVASEELATALVFLFSQKGKGRGLLEQAVQSGVRHYPQGGMLREMNFSVSVLSEYVRCWGKRYLRNILKTPLRSLLHSKTQVEIDPARLRSDQDLASNQAALVEHVGLIIRNITAARPPAHIESALRLLLSGLRNTNEGTSGYVITSTFLFLRFFCPALVSPYLYGLMKKKKTKKGDGISKEQQRKLVLTAKVLQNVANGVVGSGKEDYLSAVSSFVEESIGRVREWATQYLEVGLNTPRSDKEPESKGGFIKKGATAPYIQKVGAFLMKNEDNIRKYFEAEGNKEREKAGGKQREEYIHTCDVFLEHMDDIRKEIGGNPEQAESYEKVWERVQRRMQRLEQLQKLPGASASGSGRRGSVASGGSNNTAPVYASDSGQFMFTISTDESSPIDQSGSLTFSSGPDEGEEHDDDDATTESGLDDVHELEEVRESLLARNDVNPEGKVIFKCWCGKVKKMLIHQLASVTYEELQAAVAKKFNLSSSTLQLTYGETEPRTSLSASSFCNFLRAHGTMTESSIVYSIYVSA